MSGKPTKQGIFYMRALQDRASSSVNDTGTCATNGTPLTQGRSSDVPATLTETIGTLDRLRRTHGADSEIGWICSNAITQLTNLSKATSPEQVVNLHNSLAITVGRLALATGSIYPGASMIKNDA